MQEKTVLRIRLKSADEIDLAIDNEGAWQEIDGSVSVSDMIGLHSALSKIRDCANAIPGIQDFKQGGVYEVEVVLEDDGEVVDEDPLIIGFGVKEGVRPPRGSVSQESDGISGGDVGAQDVQQASGVLCPHCKRKIRVVSGEK